ncbi:MAG: hypothetical protein KME15_11325 [Drouetiella hepatica Uher 2000/2452]|uniref:Uncharacterized protein n=1 Tax=Drouetiella hepatica Uher 2000/2452 TaxID=904376 RepID=A0A951UP17_9CYAN|nr:hypothetical protein [Drouetiella hepatica Uher 2000/2452]
MPYLRINFFPLLTMRYDFTRTGIRHLGDFIREIMDDAGISMPKLVEQCDRVGYTTNVPKIQRLRDGVGLEPTVGLLWAIARLEMIHHPDGKPYTLEDFLRIACEQQNPYEEMRRTAEAAGSYAAFSEAIVFLKQQMRNTSLEAFARACKLPLSDMRGILQGRVPTFAELSKISAYLFADKDPTPLLKLYGIDQDMPIRSQQE